MLKKCKRLPMFVIIFTILFSQIGGLIQIYASDMDENESIEEGENFLFDNEQMLKNEEDGSLDDKQTSRQNEETLETDSKSDTFKSGDNLEETIINDDILEIESNSLDSENTIYEFIEIGHFEFFIEQISPGSNIFDVTLLALNPMNISELILPEVDEILSKMEEKLESDDICINDIIIAKNFSYHATIENNNYLRIPEGYTIIESSAFYWKKLEGVLELPDVVTIGEGAFSFNNLEKVIMPKVEEIGPKAFRSCNLKGALDLPNVKKIDEEAFAYNELNKINLPKIEELAPSAFECIIENIYNSSEEYSGIEEIIIGNPEVIMNTDLKGFNEDLKYNNYGYIPIVTNDKNIKNKIVEEKGIIINPTNDDEFHEIVINHITTEIENKIDDVKYLKYDDLKFTDLNKNNQFYRLDGHLDSLNGFYKIDTIKTEEKDGINYVVVYSDSSDDSIYYSEPIPTIDYYYESTLLDKLIYNAEKLQIKNIESLIYKITSNNELSIEDSQGKIYLNTNNFDEYISFKDCIEDEMLCEKLINSIKSDDNSYTEGTYYTYIQNNNSNDWESVAYLKDNQIMIASNKLINLSYLYLNDDLDSNILKSRNLTDKTPSRLYLPGYPETSSKPPIVDDIKPPITDDNKPSTPPSPGSGGGSSYRPSPTPKEDEVDIIEDIHIDKNKKDEKLNLSEHIQYIQGYKDNTIRPTDFITREEVAAVFFRLLNDDYRESIRTNSIDYLDISNDRWSVKHIGTLSNGNILKGYPDNTFRPTSTITRGEVAAIASRFDDLETLNSSIFPDVKGHWAEKYIDSAESKGWIKGYEDGTFRPNNPITRAEFITLVNNVLNRKVNKENIIDGIKVFRDISPEQWYYEAIIEATNSHEFESIRLEDNSEIWTKITHPNLEM